MVLFTINETDKLSLPFFFTTPVNLQLLVVSHSMCFCNYNTYRCPKNTNVPTFDVTIGNRTALEKLINQKCQNLREKRETFNNTTGYDNTHKEDVCKGKCKDGEIY